MGRCYALWQTIESVLMGYGTGAVPAAQMGATLAEFMGRFGRSTRQAALRYQHAAQDRDTQIAAAALSRLASGR